MNHADPGLRCVTGNRAFIFGGAYGNLQATKAVLMKALELGFEPHQIIFTGDMIAYCGQPVETAALLKRSGIHLIMGNCEASLANGAEDCGCGFEQGSACDALSGEWYSFCKSRIHPATARWMGTLPRNLLVDISGFNLLCTHATPDSINRFVFPSSIDPRDYGDFDGYVVGHSGIPFVAETNGKPWINSGAAGMPANDGTPRVWYATLEASTNSLTVETRALEYDHASAAGVMKQAGLDNGYRQCLLTGIWPSDGVLPKVERRQTGIALQSQKRTFLKRPVTEPV